MSKDNVTNYPQFLAIGHLSQWHVGRSPGAMATLSSCKIMLVRDWSSLKMESGQHLVSGWIRFQRTTIFGIQARRVGVFAGVQSARGNLLVYPASLQVLRFALSLGSWRKTTCYKNKSQNVFLCFFCLTPFALDKAKGCAFGTRRLILKGQHLVGWQDKGFHNWMVLFMLPSLLLQRFKIGFIDQSIKKCHFVSRILNLASCLLVVRQLPTP